MKRIGLIGGVSPESTAIYYRLLNKAAQQRYGGEHSADLILYSLDYGVMLDCYSREDWTAFIGHVVDAGRRLDAAGCGVLAIASNTTNLAADDLASTISAPVIYLQNALVDAMRDQQVSKPLLLGTRVTMEGPFYRSALLERHGVVAEPPNEPDRTIIDRIIFDELTHGEIKEESRREYLRIIETSKEAGFDSVILGCTEIGMLIEQKHTHTPVLDTTLIHAQAIADFAFDESNA